MLGSADGGRDGDLMAEEGLEWRGELTGDVVLVVDPDPLEEGLVELPANGGPGVAVCGMPVAGTAEKKPTGPSRWSRTRAAIRSGRLPG